MIHWNLKLAQRLRDYSELEKKIEKTESVLFYFAFIRKHAGIVFLGKLHFTVERPRVIFKKFVLRSNVRRQC